MKQAPRRETPRPPRFRVSSAIQRANLTSASPSSGAPRVLRGTIRDISAGGVCLELDRPVKQSQVVRCDFPIPQLSVAIPTLMNVRWIRRISKTPRYAIGLQFLF
ncbi:MAG: hypothetical protein DMG32_01115 [Acidobacteria bacterium]|nr:MAG: hypothetical protein DMG32_01115 [Acidobacteriota bacterium]